MQLWVAGSRSRLEGRRCEWSFGCRRKIMLRLEVSLPSICGITSREIQVCAEVRDATIGILIRLCRLPSCKLPFIPRLETHDFCTAEHRMLFHNKYSRYNEPHE